MFNDIGSKIKTLAKQICWLGIILSIVVGVIVINTNDELIFAGVLIIVLGFVISWVGCFVLYGFGELVNNSSIIAQNGTIVNPKETNDNSTISLSYSPGETVISHTSVKGKCEMCDKEDIDIYSAKVVDDRGTRYRKVCSDCYQKYNCQ